MARRVAREVTPKRSGLERDTLQKTATDENPRPTIRANAFGSNDLGEAVDEDGGTPEGDECFFEIRGARQEKCHSPFGNIAAFDRIEVFEGRSTRIVNRRNVLDESIPFSSMPSPILTPFLFRRRGWARVGVGNALNQETLVDNLGFHTDHLSENIQASPFFAIQIPDLGQEAPHDAAELISSSNRHVYQQSVTLLDEIPFRGRVALAGKSHNSRPC